MNEQDYLTFRDYCEKLGLGTFAEIERFKNIHHAKDNAELLAAMKEEIGDALHEQI
jgi:hypothetical protein